MLVWWKIKNYFANHKSTRFASLIQLTQMPTFLKEPVWVWRQSFKLLKSGQQQLPLLD